MLLGEIWVFFQVEKVLHCKSRRPIPGKSPIFLISGLPTAAWMWSIGNNLMYHYMARYYGKNNTWSEIRCPLQHRNPQHALM